MKWPSTLPLSLAARILLLIVASSVVTSLAAALFLFPDRDLGPARAAVQMAAVRVADAYRVFGGIPAPLRAQALPALSTIGPLQPPAYNREGDPKRAAALATELRGILPAGALTGVSPGTSRTSPDLVLGAAYAGTAPELTDVLDASVRLTDGSNLVIRVAVEPRPGPPVGAIALNMSVFIGLLFLGSWWLARTLTSPVTRLAVAADALGRGEDVASLADSGPPEVRRAARAFNSMRDRMRRYIDTRTHALAAMSHDLRTPITRLRLRAIEVEDAGLRDKIEQDLGEMGNMVQGTLDMLHGLSANEPAHPVDIAALVESIRDNFADMGFDVEIGQCIQSTETIRPDLMRRALSNLVENARRYAGSARIDVSIAGDELLFAVADEGTGIPEAQIDRVFEPFYRLESSRNKESGGMGLGLSIARDIAQAHGGTLTLRNRTTGGLVAALQIPRVARG